MGKFRMSLSILHILAQMYARPGEETFGLDLSRATTIKTSALYPALERLEKHGYITSRWEEIDTRAEGRPKRRYYRLTEAGLNLAEEQLPRAPSLPAHQRAAS